MKLFVTGGAGFIGSCFIRHILLKYPDYKVMNLDILSYAGNLNNLADFKNNLNYKFIKGDICDKEIIYDLMAEADCCLNFAAETHVDRSILDPNIFVYTNVLGTQNLLYAAKELKLKRFIQISTDEVYGSLGATGYFRENTSLSPNSPYSASKASADLLVRAYFKTYKVPALITRCSNNYGPYQYPEKLIPFFIINALKNEFLPVYGDGLNIRDWLYVYDHCSAIDIVLHNGKEGEIYNIGGNNEKTNLEITGIILKQLNKPLSLKKFVQDRLAHDRRYAIDSSKIQDELGWKPETSFKDGIKQTIDWYIKNTDWVEKIMVEK
ncbi:MAG: dTDP-glucose 4,6-dehydratase [bacterium]